MKSLEKKVNAGHINLIDKLKKEGIVKSSSVEQALKAVDRCDFVSKYTPFSDVYDDCPQPIGFSATISAPHMHAYALVFTSVQQLGTSSSWIQAKRKSSRCRIWHRDIVSRRI